MSMQWRLFDARRTLVLPVYSSQAEKQTQCIWIAFHGKDKDWAGVFSRAIDLLMEEPATGPQEVSFAEGAGRIAWRQRAFWTIIRLRLETFSRKKRRLVAAALLKSSRYGT
jgi:hypothetical protein